jgi:hypothetical protein
MIRFRNWCKLRGVPHLPAAASEIAAFVAETALSAECLSKELEAIDSAHEELGYGPPAKSRIVVDAFSAVHHVPPPRSWSKDELSFFETLPHGAKLAIARRESDRDRALSRSLNELAEQRKQLEKKNDNPQAA